MKSVRIQAVKPETEGLTHVQIGKGQKEYTTIESIMQSLPFVNTQGSQSINRNFIILWEFSPEELMQLIKQGGRFWYTRMAFEAPFQPMNITIDNPFSDKIDDSTAPMPFPKEILRFFEMYTATRKSIPLSHDLAEGKPDELWVELAELFSKTTPTADKSNQDIEQALFTLSAVALRLSSVYAARRHF